MELRWKNNKTKAVGIAFVTDSDAEVLVAMDYYHAWREDVQDDELDGALVEIWKPVGTEEAYEDDNTYGCDMCGERKDYDKEIIWITSTYGVCEDCYNKLTNEDKDKIRNDFE